MWVEPTSVMAANKHPGLQRQNGGRIRIDGMKPQKGKQQEVAISHPKMPGKITSNLPLVATWSQKTTMSNWKVILRGPLHRQFDS